MQSEAVDEKDVTFDDEMETAGSHTAETKPSRQVPDEDLDEVFRDNRVHDTDGEFDGEPPKASGSTFDEIDRAARAVKDPKARESDVLQAGKVFHELEGTEFYNMFRRNNARYEARVSEMVETYLASIQPAEKKTRMKAAVRHVPAKQCPLRGKGVGNGGNLSCKHPARREENKNESGCTEGIRELQHPRLCMKIRKPALSEAARIKKVSTAEGNLPPGGINTRKDSDRNIEEKTKPSGSPSDGCQHLRLCSGQRHGGHHRSNQYGDLVF